jgi:DNA recombination-dependent growth factor C
MGAINGTATFKRFFIMGDPGKGLAEKGLKSINARRFTPTTESEVVSFGWVPMTDPLADKLGPADVFVGELVCLGFRVDERKVSAADVRDEMKLRTRELQYERGRRLAKMERAALKDAIVAELRARAPVRRKVAELVWSPRRQEARLYGGGKAQAQMCAEVFARTFELAMEEADVTSVALRVGVDLKKVKLPAVSLAGLAPSRLPARDESAGGAS